MVYPHTFRTIHSETVTTNSVYGSHYAEKIRTKIPVNKEVLELYRFVDSNRLRFIEDLRRAVGYMSISASLRHQVDVTGMMDHVKDWLARLGAKYEDFFVGYQEINGVVVSLPTVLIATIGPKSRKTLLIYSHIDVSAPCRAKWDTDPFSLTETDKKLYGKGTAKGKGPLICWFHAIEAYLTKHNRLPITIKFIIEAMHEHESAGLEDFLRTQLQTSLVGVTSIVVCDSEWIGPKYPCLVYGSVGFCHYKLVVEKTPESSTEPSEDIEKICEKICDPLGNVLIPKFNDYVKQITPDEEMLYNEVKEISMDAIRATLPPERQGWDKVRLLMRLWRLPSIEMGEILGCNCEKKDCKTKVRNLMIKIVPNQTPERITDCLVPYVQSVCKEMNCQNNVDLELLSSTRPWVESIKKPVYVAAKRATIQTYKETPSLIREGRDMKIVLLLHRVFEKPILVLPLGNSEINAGQENENISLRNFYEGTKLMASFLYQYSHEKSNHNEK